MLYQVNRMLNTPDLSMRLERARLSAGLTKEALRVAARVSPATLLKILAGDWTTVPYGSIERVWTCVGLPQEELAAAPGWARRLETRLGRIEQALGVPPAVDDAGQSAAAGEGGAGQAAAGASEAGPAQSPRRRSGLALELVQPPASGVIRIPMSKVGAGGGYFQETRVEPEAWYELPARLRPQDGELRVLEVHGDSMEPELREGELIVVHYPSQQPAYSSLHYGEMYVITDEDYTDMVKRYVLDHETGRDMLVSTNPAYLPQPLSTTARYIGRVTQIIKQ
jgi:SOS-response transcriptional repressor LexA